MKKISSEEFELKGKWILENGKIVEDETCNRINYLIANYLIKIAGSSSGWETLYQDPLDKRYWELKYLESELNGGGPPTLINLNSEAARVKFDNVP